MNWLIYRPNLLDRTKDIVTPVLSAKTVREAFLTLWPTFQEFTAPTIVLVNGVPTLRAKWDDELRANSTIEACAVPGALTPAIATVSLLLTIGSLAYSAYLYYTAPSIPSFNPPAIGTTPEAAPVFAFEGQRNERRLNQPIEVAYGRNRWYPGFLCLSRIVYVENTPYLIGWYSLGKGDFEIEDVRIGETSITTLPNSQYIQFDSGTTTPAGNATLDNDDIFDYVKYIEELSNAELRGTNEAEYKVLGPYRVKAITYGSSVSKFQINLSFPGGLYELDASSNLVEKVVTLRARWRQINENGANPGDWEGDAFLSDPYFEMLPNGTTTTPQRFTFSATLSQNLKWGWEFEIYRTDTKETTIGGADTVRIESVCFLDKTEKTYDVTTLNVIVQGSEFITSGSSAKVNVVATRKLPTLVDGSFTAPVATRNSVWAFLDVLRSDYGAQTPNDQLDLTYFEDLGESTSINFDAVFKQKTTVLEALKAIATVMHGAPYLAGSDYRIAVDDPLAVPVAFFSMDNVSDLTWEMAFSPVLDADCVEVSYIDPDSGLEDTVQFTPPGSDGVNPRRLTAVGVQDRTLAWRMGAYSYLSESLRRDRVTFTTGMEGYIPTFGDTIMVAWPFPAWGTAGLVTAYDAATLTLALSEDVTFDGPETHWIALRTRTGEVYGPVRCEVASVANAVLLLEPLSDGFFTGYFGEQPIMFTFGKSSTLAKEFAVTALTPTANNTSVQVEALSKNRQVFAYEFLDAPDPGDDLIEYAPVATQVPWVRVLKEEANALRIVWAPTPGATSYTVRYNYLDSITTPILSQPWTYVSTILESDNLDAYAFIPRVEGKYLFVTVTPDVGDTRWLRIYVGVRGSTTNLSKPVALTILDATDPLKVASGTITANLSEAFDATSSTGPTYYIDAPDDCGVRLELTTLPADVTRSITLPNGGAFTYTPSMAKEDGFYGENGTPSFVANVFRAGESTAYIVDHTMTYTRRTSPGTLSKSVSSAKVLGLSFITPYWVNGVRYDYTDLQTVTYQDVTFKLSTASKYGVDWIMSRTMSFYGVTVETYNRSTATPDLVLPIFWNSNGVPTDWTNNPSGVTGFAAYQTDKATGQTNAYEDSFHVACVPDESLPGNTGRTFALFLDVTNNRILPDTDFQCAFDTDITADQDTFRFAIGAQDVVNSGIRPLTSDERTALQAASRVVFMHCVPKYTPHTMFDSRIQATPLDLFGKQAASFASLYFTTPAA